MLHLKVISFWCSFRPMSIIIFLWQRFSPWYFYFCYIIYVIKLDTKLMFEWKLSVNNKRIDLTWSSRQYLNLKIISLFVNVRVDYSEQIKKNVNSYISEKIYQKLNKRLSKHSFFTIEHSIKRCCFRHWQWNIIVLGNGMPCTILKSKVN